MDLVGRRAERGGIAAAAAQAKAGRTTVVQVRGDAGTGKTSLLDDARANLVADGWLVLDGTVGRAETDIGWASVAGVVRRLPVDVVEGRSPAQRDALRAAAGFEDAHGIEPLRLAAALSDLISDLAATCPVVLLVDDLHWLDPPSAGAYSFLLRTVVEAPLLVLLGTRPTPAPIEPERLPLGERLVTFELGGLSIGGIRELLLRQVGVDLGRIDLIRLHEASGGNPLHVWETGRALRDGTPIEDAIAPRSLAELMGAEVDRLDAAWLDPLRVAAAIPHPELADVRSLCGDRLAAAAIDGAERLGVLSLRGRALRFRHPLLETALLDGLSTLERRALHRRCAAHATDLEVRAVHLAAAADGPDPDAAEVLDAAALAAEARGVANNAARHALAALELTPADDSAMLHRRQRLAAAYTLKAGDSGAALRLAEQVLPFITDQDERIQLLGIIVIGRATTVDTSAAIADVHALIDAHPEGSAGRVDSLLMLARLLVFEDPAESAAAAEHAVVAAHQLGDSDLIDQAEGSRAITLFLAAEPIDLDPLVARCLDTDGYRSQTMPLRGMVAELCVWSDRLAEASDLLEREQEYAVRNGELVTAMNVANQLAAVCERTGRWIEGSAHVERARTIAIAIGNDQVATVRSAELARFDAVMGHTRAAQEAIRVARLAYDELPSMLKMEMDYTAGVAAAYMGDHAQAAAMLTSAATIASDGGLLDIGCLPFHFELVESLLATDRLDAALAVVAKMRAAADRSQRPRPLAEAARAEAAVLAAQGDLAAATVAVDDANTRFALLDLPFEHARTKLLAGRLARRTNQRTRARQHLGEALAIFQRLGAQQFAQRTTTELNRVGGDTPGGLTATEAQVAALVAAGNTNDEVAALLFVTRRTVEANLTRIYRKLGVRSRTELARRLSAQNG